MSKDKAELLPGQGQRMRLARHPALRQRRTSNGLDAVTVRSWLEFGSALTFGAAKKASAPGQMGVADLAQVFFRECRFV